MKTLRLPYAFLMGGALAFLQSARDVRIPIGLAKAKEIAMLAVTLVVSCLFAFGFYAYVLIQLRREMKRGDAIKNRVPEHLYEMDHDPRREGSPDAKQKELLHPRAGASSSRRVDAQHRETMFCLGFTGIGLAALIAGIEVFNSLANSASR